MLPVHHFLFCMSRWVLPSPKQMRLSHTFEVPFARADVWRQLMSLSNSGLCFSGDSHVTLDFGKDQGGRFRSSSHFRAANALHVGMMQQRRLSKGGIITCCVTSLIQHKLIVWDIISQLGTAFVLHGAGHIPPKSSVLLDDWWEDRSRILLGTQVTLTYEYAQAVAAHRESDSYVGAEATTSNAGIESVLIGHDVLAHVWWSEMLHHAEPVGAGESALIAQGVKRPRYVPLASSVELLQSQWRAHLAAKVPAPKELAPRWRNWFGTIKSGSPQLPRTAKSSQTRTAKSSRKSIPNSRSGKGLQFDV